MSASTSSSMMRSARPGPRGPWSGGVIGTPLGAQTIDVPRHGEYHSKADAHAENQRGDGVHSSTDAHGLFVHAATSGIQEMTATRTAQLRAMLYERRREMQDEVRSRIGDERPDRPKEGRDRVRHRRRAYGLNIALLSSRIFSSLARRAATSPAPRARSRAGTSLAAMRRPSAMATCASRSAPIDAMVRPTRAG